MMVIFIILFFVLKIGLMRYKIYNEFNKGNILFSKISN